jgi:hypothetical protein
MRTKLARLIAKQEGYFKPGSLPARRHNPGDLRHSPHSSHDGIDRDAVGAIDSDEHGWEDLERQLQLDAGRGMTLGQAIYSWAPPSENDTANYLQHVIEGLGGSVTADTPLTEVLQIAA